MINKTILKIFDNEQFSINNAFKDFVIPQSSNKYFFESFDNDIFKSVDSIETDENLKNNNFYIVPIVYYNEDHFTQKPWLDYVKKFITKHKTVLQQNNVYLCICDFYETSKKLVYIAEDLQYQFDVKIWIISADKKLKSGQCRVIYNDTWIKRFEPASDIIRYKPNKIYINLTRVARWHRCLLTDRLIDNDLLKYGFNTWGDVYTIFGKYKAENPNTKIDKVKFDTLDIEDLSSINPNYNVPKKHCIHSFLYLSTETSVDSENMFFSEKIYKPIGIGMPFITLGNPGTLQDLRNRGFVTFSEWIDETYDNDYNINRRIQIIIENIKKFSTYNRNDLITIRKDMEPILQHNLNLYKMIRSKNILKENLQLAIREEYVY